jgi:hypothetical protein
MTRCRDFAGNIETRLYLFAEATGFLKQPQGRKDKSFDAGLSPGRRSSEA